MLKVGRRFNVLLVLPTLPMLLLIAAFLLNAVEAVTGTIPTAQAAGFSATRDSCTSSSDKPSFGSEVVIADGEVICSNITSFGGTVIIRGVVNGDVVSFGGDVVIAGRVNGNIKLYGGNVTLQDGAAINGDIHLCGGQWIQGRAYQLHGALVDCSMGIGQLLADDGGLGFHLWSLLIWVAFGVLLTSLLPEHVMLVRTTAKTKRSRSLVLGLLSVLLAPIVLLVLTALIISIPLAIIVAIGLVAAWILGTVAIGWQLGDVIIRRVAPQHNTRLIQVVVGLTVLVLAGSLPYIGLFISVGAGLVGLGAVFLSRFGTRLYSPPKQPLTL
jgi:hypothetical protein